MEELLIEHQQIELDLDLLYYLQNLIKKITKFGVMRNVRFSLKTDRFQVQEIRGQPV